MLQGLSVERSLYRHHINHTGTQCPQENAYKVSYMHCSYVHILYTYNLEVAHLSVSFSSSLGGRRDALFERSTDPPPVCVRLEREKKEMSKERVKDGDERGRGNAIKYTGCKFNNGKSITKHLRLDLPCFWPPFAPSVSSGNTSPVWNTNIMVSYWDFYISNISSRVCF